MRRLSLFALQESKNELHLVICSMKEHKTKNSQKLISDPLVRD